MAAVKPNKWQRTAWLALLLAAFALAFVLSWMSPLMAEDYMYLFSFADGERIDSLGDIIPSMSAHRLSMNGRVFAHSLTHAFLMLPRLAFALANGLNFVLLLLVASRFFGGEGGGLRLILLCGFICLSWIFIPAYGQCFFWLVGAFNYSWTLTFTLALVLPFFTQYLCGESKLTKPGNVPVKLGYVLLAFVAGGYSENSSCAALLLCTLFMPLSYLRDKKLPAVLTLGFLSACAGFLFMMSAPSEMGGRTSDFSFAAVAANVSWMFQTVRENLIVLICLFAALFVLALMRKVEKKYLVAAAVLLLGAAASIGVFAVAAYFPQRSMCTATVYLILACLLLAGKLAEKGLGELLAAGAAALLVVFLFSFALGLFDIFGVFLESRSRDAAVEAAIAAGEETVYLPQYKENTKYSAAWGTADITPEQDVGYNSWIADYYGIGQVVGLPD